MTYGSRAELADAIHGGTATLPLPHGNRPAATDLKSVLP